VLAQSLGGMSYYLICAIAGLIVLGMAANEWLRLGSGKYRRIATSGGVTFLGRLIGVAVLLTGSQRVIAYQEWALESLTLAVIVWAFLVSALAAPRWAYGFLSAASVSVFGILLLSLLLEGRASSVSVPPGPWWATLLLSFLALVLWFWHRKRFSIWLGSIFLVSSLSAIGGLLGAVQVAMLGHLAMLLLVVIESYRSVLSDVGALGRQLQARNEQARKQTQEMAFLLAVGRTLSDSLDLRAVLERISEAVARAVDADWAYILMPLSEDDEQLVVAARYGWWGRRWTQDSHPSRRMVIDSSELSLIRHAILRRRSVLVNEPGDYEQFECLHDRFARPQSGPALIQPITRQERTLGVLLLGRVDLSPREYGLSHRQFTDADAQLCQDLMVHIGAAIENARLYESIFEQSQHAVQLLSERESESLSLQSTLDALTNGVVVVTDAGNVALANAAAERILNVPRQHLLGRIITPLYAELLRHEEIRPGDEVLFTWDDKLLKSCLSPVRQPDGTLLGDVVVFRDVTAEEHAEQAKTEYDSAFSRKLQNLLFSVRADTHMLAESVAKSASLLQQELLDLVVANIKQMTALLLDFKKVSNLEHDEIQIEAQAVDIGAIIDKAVRIVRAEAVASNLELVVDLPSELSRAWGDPRHLRRIVLNLLDYTMRHTPAGGKIDVWATEVSAAHRDASSRGFLVVSIRNPGTFIPSGEQDQLLEYLDPLDAGHAAGSAGALAVSKGLVAAHGGWISVASEPGQGSTLSFSIPAAGAA
jgi:two-component system phosphate regulon sensor histidine kinase PhoR